METENKDWKPEVGKHVWVVENYAILQKKVLRVDPSLCCLLRGRRGDDFYEGFKCHPTPEAALASIKIYDLEGKEVVIPRAEPDFLLQELESSGRILSMLEKEFFEFCKQCPENVAKFGLALMGGGAANGGKLYETELDSEIKYVAKSKKPISDFDAQKLHFYLNDERGVSGSCEPIDWKLDAREGGC